MTELLASDPPSVIKVFLTKKTEIFTPIIENKSEISLPLKLNENISFKDKLDNSLDESESESESSELI